MNRKELIDSIASATDLTKAQATDALAAALDGIVGAVAKGDKVSLPGFGTFEPRERAARTGRNPQTGEAVEIAASTSPAFKAASAFKEAVNS
jgi:DNA-binding protein HU-beta